MEIKLRKKSVYGKDFFYPISDDSKALCEIAGRKTITRKHMEILEGYNIDVIIDEE